MSKSSHPIRFALLAAASLPLPALGCDATLTWTPPRQRTDGSPLTADEISGYRIRWGTAPSDLSSSRQVDRSITSTVVDGLTDAVWYFAATTIDANGFESALSNIAQKTITGCGAPPTPEKAPPRPGRIISIRRV